MGLLTAAVAIAAVATGGSLYYQNRAAREQRRMNEFQRTQADLQAARQRRDTIRSNRLANSQAVMNANAQNVTRSSGAMGGQDSLISQGLSNLSFMDTMNTLSDQASAAYGRAISYGNTANMFSGIASLAMTASSFITPAVDQVQNKAPQGTKPSAFTPRAHSSSPTMTPSYAFGFQTNNKR